jgi:hypothetical protein
MWNQTSSQWRAHNPLKNMAFTKRALLKTSTFPQGYSKRWSYLCHKSLRCFHKSTWLALVTSRCPVPSMSPGPRNPWIAAHPGWFDFEPPFSGVNWGAFWVRSASKHCALRFCWLSSLKQIWEDSCQSESWKSVLQQQAKKMMNLQFFRTWSFSIRFSWPTWWCFSQWESLRISAFPGYI